MPDLAFAIPGDLSAHTGGYLYDARLIAEFRAAGLDVRVLNWGHGFPAPTPAERQSAAADLAALPDNLPVLIDGLACGVLPEEIAHESARLCIVALVHHPLALETGLTQERRTSLAASERAALRDVRAVVTTSRHTAETLVRDWNVASDKITVALPGTELHLPPRARSDTPRLLAVGAVIPRKGHDILVEALTRITDLPWTCTIIGSLTRDPAWSDALRARITSLGLTPRIALPGEVPSIAPFLARADIFVLPSRHEGYGMAFAEALQASLPIIGTTAGAIPELVPPNACILVPPDNAPALAHALAALIRDRPRRDIMAEASRQTGGALPRWAETARRVLAILHEAAATTG